MLWSFLSKKKQKKQEELMLLKYEIKMFKSQKDRSFDAEALRKDCASTSYCLCCFQIRNLKGLVFP